MTWASVTRTGSGQIDFRLKIEGLPVEWCTARRLERDPDLEDDIVRCVEGLKHEGLAISEEADLIKGEIKLSSITAKICDLGLYTTDAFSRLPTVTTYLTAFVGVGDNTVPVYSVAGLSVGDVIHINTEAMLITAINEETKVLTVDRAWFGTIEQKHWVESGESIRLPQVNNRPLAIQGRRAYLYAYGDNEPNPGTQRFIGIVSSEPSLGDDGGTWTVQIDPITFLLNGDMGGDQNAPMRPRGIYYSEQEPIEFNIGWVDGTVSIGEFGTVKVEGFYESQNAFCNAVNAKLATVTSGFSEDVEIFTRPIDDSRWVIVAKTTSIYQVPIVTIRSVIDQVESDTHRVRGWRSSVRSIQFRDNDGNNVNQYQFTPGEEFFAYVSAPVPRGVWGTNGDDDHRWDADSTVTAPCNRIYLSGTQGILAGASVAKIEWDNEEVSSDMYLVNGADNDEGWAYFSALGAGSNPAGAIGYGGNTKVTFSADFVSDVTASTTLSDYLENLITISPEWANIGVLPFITANDIDMAASRQAIDKAIQGRPAIGHRVYTKLTPTKFSEWLSEELKLLGCYVALNASGQIVIKQLQMPGPNSFPDGEITPDNTLMETWPRFTRSPFGIINTINIATEYDISSDQWVGDRIQLRDPTSFGAVKVARSLDIKPRSNVWSRNGVTVPQLEDYLPISETIFGMFGNPYRVVTLDIPMSLFNEALIGNVLSFTNRQLPDPLTGKRGFTRPKLGLVQSRTWDLETGRGTISLYIPETNIAGYTPTARVIDTDGDDTTWVVTVDNADIVSDQSWWPEGSVCSDLFEIGDRVKVWQWDSTSTVVRRGIVTNVINLANQQGDIYVEFDVAWTPGASAWLIGFDDADEISAEHQKPFAYMAMSDLKITFADETVTAKVFSA